MKAHYKTADGRMQFEVSGDHPKDVFEQIASVQELFEADAVCGICHSTEQKGLRFVVRTVDDNKYYEIRCLQCFARLQFGQNKKGGGLFPKRYDKDGGRLENRGWSKYEKPANRPAAAAPASQAPLPGARSPQPMPAPRTPVPPPQYDSPGYSAGITDDDVPF